LSAGICCTIPSRDSKHLSALMVNTNTVFKYRKIL